MGSSIVPQAWQNTLVTCSVSMQLVLIALTLAVAMVSASPQPQPQPTSVPYSQPQTNRIPQGAGTEFYYEGCSDGRGLRCGPGLQACWDICDCQRICPY